MPTPDLRRLLVIEDDPASQRLMRAIFSTEGFEVTVVGDGAQGVETAAAEPFELVLCDLQLPGLDGLQVLEQLKASQPKLPVVMVTAQHDPKPAVRAVRLGAFDYLTKPIDHDEVVLVVRRALEARALEREVQSLRARLGGGQALVAQMGPSAAVRALAEQVTTVAASQFTVLVLGETGAGKELVAQALHRESTRSAAPLVAIDCGAIPEALLESELFGHERGAFTGAERRRAGRFELAKGGTVFLDEIGNLPLQLQSKLLRVLESRQLQAVGASEGAALDVRFVAATNDDLQVKVQTGHFRADLYFRLAQYTLQVPPLRARRSDVRHLAQRFLDEAAVELKRPVQGFAPGAFEALERHGWPGNVRELRNVVRRAVLQTKSGQVGRDEVRALLGEQAESHARPGPRAGGRTLRQVAEEAARAAEAEAIREALEAARGNKAQAARALRTDYKTLHLKLKQLGIRARDFSP
ncbi:MAG: sigma-54-dependent Fis family transcriptional regulator [Archangiaceae bacterium]|nr:sigma-54-dependent Fis family transcriptional regulator [Archangiaceae bacterium]